MVPLTKLVSRREHLPRLRQPARATHDDGMNTPILGRQIVALLVVCAVALLGPSIASAQTQYTVTPLAQKKVQELPAGPLYWRVETFATVADAKAAVGPDG
jgi:hypothetical protein